MTEKKSYAKSLVLVAGKMTFNILFFFTVGVLINWVYAFIVLWDFGDGFTFTKVLLLLVFFVVFPFLYFWKAKSYAIMTGLKTLYTSSEGFFRSIVGLITGIVVGRMEKMQDGKGLTSNILNGAVNTAKKSEKLPGPIRWILNFFLNQIPLREALIEAGQEVDLKMENIEEVKVVVFDKINTYVKDELLDNGASWFWILLGINVTVIVGTYYLFIA